MRKLILAAISLSFAVLVCTGESWAQKARPHTAQPHKNSFGLYMATMFLFLYDAKEHIEDIQYQKELAFRALSDDYEYSAGFNEALKIIKDYDSPRESPSVRRAARAALAELPDKFDPDFAYRRDDGTVARDPDSRVRSQLARDRYSLDGGDGDAN